MGGTVEGVPRLKPEKQSGENSNSAESKDGQVQIAGAAPYRSCCTSLDFVETNLALGSSRYRKSQARGQKAQVITHGESKIADLVRGGGVRFMAGSFTLGDL